LPPLGALNPNFPFRRDNKASFPVFNIFALKNLPQPKNQIRPARTAQSDE
jgi:hypothetical protein